MMTHPNAITVLFLGPSTPLTDQFETWLQTTLSAPLTCLHADQMLDAEAQLHTRPADMIIVDLVRPDTPNREALRLLQTMAPHSARLALMAQPNDSRTYGLLQDGAHEVLALADTPPTDACRTIARALARAGKPIPPFTLTPHKSATAPANGKLVHDLNNLVMSINGFADLLVSRLASHDPSRLFAEHIRKAGQRAADLLATQRTVPQPSTASDPPTLGKAA